MAFKHPRDRDRVFPRKDFGDILSVELLRAIDNRLVWRGQRIVGEGRAAIEAMPRLIEGMQIAFGPGQILPTPAITVALPVPSDSWNCPMRKGFCL